MTYGGSVSSASRGAASAGSPDERVSGAPRPRALEHGVSGDAVERERDDRRPKSLSGLDAHGSKDDSSGSPPRWRCSAGKFADLDELRQASASSSAAAHAQLAAADLRVRGGGGGGGGQEDSDLTLDAHKRRVLLGDDLERHQRQTLKSFAPKSLKRSYPLENGRIQALNQSGTGVDMGNCDDLEFYEQ